MSDLATLFARDPDSLTTTDIDAIIAHLRDARAKFNLGVKQAGNAKKAIDLNKKLDEAPTLDLGELGL